MSSFNLNAYFERLGFSGSIAPTLATLEILHALHPAAIPFENLSPLMDQPVSLDQASLEQKLLHDRRGGYCFEHNTLFMRMLRELDYTVRGYVARSLWGHAPDADRPLSHMMLVVDIGGMSYLCDVGFGGTTPTAPLKLRADVEQTTPHETFKLTALDEGFRLDVLIGEEWKPMYRFDLIEQSDADYAALNETIALDHRTRNLLVAARAEKGVRHNLSFNRLTTYRVGEGRERRELADAAEIREVLSGVFGIALPPADLLDPMLERVLATAAALKA